MVETTAAVSNSTEAPQNGSPPTLSPSPHQDDQVNEAEDTQSLRCPEHGDDSNCRYLGLDTKQREEITARLVGRVQISFTNTSEALRNHTSGASKRLPPFFYRTFYETSVTLSSRVSKDTHVKHRERQRLKILKGNAFQAVGEVNIRRDLTKPRIQRHLIWNKKRDPSSYISVFNDLKHAKRRADFHYSNSQRIGHRVLIAEICTKGLIPATLSGTCETTWGVFTKVMLGESLKSTVTSRSVDIPIWVSARMKPADGSSITLDEFEAAGAELWMSISELRTSNLSEQPHGHDRRRMLFADGHDYEWLSLGSISERRIKRIMPWDGEKLHENPGPRTIFSKHSPEPWIYDRDLQSWRLDAELFAQAKYPHVNNVTSKQRKRQRPSDFDEALSQDTTLGPSQQVLSISAITTAAYCYV